MLSIDDSSRQEVREALTHIDAMRPGTLKEILHDPDRKAFRNAYASIIIENAWNPYSRLVTEGLYAIEFDEDGNSSLRSIPMGALDGMQAPDIANLIAKSNQDVLTYFICVQFAGGRIPQISDDPDKNQEYFTALKEQTDLDLYARSNFRTIPETAGSPSVFVTSGSHVIRTHIYGLLNVIDQVTERDNLHLTSTQHRNGFAQSLRRVIAHYYLPTTTVILGINRKLIDRQAIALDPDSWTYNHDPDNVLVYPKPGIVAEVNAVMRTVDTLPAQTYCPAFHGRVTTAETPDIVTPLPRSLHEVALSQLDKWYYPRRVG